MTDKDFASNCALEVACRAGRILPVLQSYLDINALPQLTEVQQAALGSVVLTIFDGITETLGRMCDTHHALQEFAPVGFGEQVERWLRSRTEGEPRQ